MPTLVERYAGATPVQYAQRRITERKGLAIASVVLLFCLFPLSCNKKKSFSEITKQSTDGQVVNLNQLAQSDELIPILQPHFSDIKDQSFLAQTIAEHVAQYTLPNVGELNKLTVSVEEAQAKGGTYFKDRIDASRRLIGFTPTLYNEELTNPKPLPSVLHIASGTLQITGQVLETSGMPLANTLVILQSNTMQDTLRTDSEGKFQFLGLEQNDSFGILPLKPSYEFRRQRLYRLKADTHLTFTAKPHTIRLMESDTFHQVKARLLVRSPGEYQQSLWIIFLLFFGVFWSIHFFWSKNHFQGDAYLLPLLLLLSGLGLVMMVSIPDPLRDLFRVWDMGFAIVLGAILMFGISFIDVQRWGYEFSERKGKSFIWLGLAGFLSIMLLWQGFGPEGSNAKVNLPLFIFFGPGIQPVEIIKACLLIFFAGYLARNWQFLRELDATLPNWASRLQINLPNFFYLIPIVIGVGFSLGFFYLQKDLGPALVICTTFLVLYGIVRNHWLGVALGFLGLIGGFWLAYQINTTVGNRIEMWLEPWDNFAAGGDHLAHVYWSMASGGFLGRGLGAGTPIDMPNAHTDMILAAFGEEMGLWGITLMFLLYGWLFYRGIQIALTADAKFSFFLAIGIVLSSSIQLILITGGVFGILPLTGVVSPFLSYGKVSVIINFLFMGILFSISTQFTAQHTQKPIFGNALKVCQWVFVMLATILLAKAFYIQVMKEDEWAIKPSLVYQASGIRGYSYNPRLLRIRDALAIGTIYDRNGIPLASSHADTLQAYASFYQQLDVPLNAYELAQNKRFYPFKEHTFYLLGDLNTRVKWNAPNGFYAENTFLSELRGYDNHPTASTEKIRLPSGLDTTYALVQYDYRALLPFLKYGMEAKNPKVKKDKDIHLTIDVQLQKRLAETIRFKAQSLGIFDKTISAIVLDAKRGDILSAITYPLPQEVYTNPSAAHLNETLFDHSVYTTRAPGSTMKLATTMAAFRKAGDSANSWTVNVTGNEKYYRTGAPTGTITLEQAIIRSSNVYFATIATERIGGESLLNVLQPLGFSIKNQNYTREQQLERLYQGDNLAQVGFGQGEVIGAPLHVARMAATIANGGTYQPTSFRLLPDSLKQPSIELVTSSQAQMISRYMLGVTTQGTASGIKSMTSLPIYGKTGTAQIDKNINHNYGWFVAYTPDGYGSYMVVAVSVESAGTKGAAAAYPIVAAIFDTAKELKRIK